MIDYHSPRIPVKLAAEAAGFNVSTLRSLYERGRFRVVGGEAAKAKGLGHSLNLLDTLHIAVAKRLMDVGVDPAQAFERSLMAIHSGDDRRDPGRVFNERQHEHTVFIYYPGSGLCRLIATGGDLPFSDWAFDPQTGRRGTALTFLYNDVEKQVFGVLQAAGQLGQVEP